MAKPRSPQRKPHPWWEMLAVKKREREKTPTVPGKHADVWISDVYDYDHKNTGRKTG